MLAQEPVIIIVMHLTGIYIFSFTVFEGFPRKLVRTLKQTVDDLQRWILNSIVLQTRKSSSNYHKIIVARIVENNYCNLSYSDINFRFHGFRRISMEIFSSIEEKCR